MSNKERTDEQTAFTMSGIPSPPRGKEDVAPTDMISPAVEQIMDNIEDAFTDNTGEDPTKQQES